MPIANSRSPNLETILMVQNFIEKNSNKYKRRELWEKLPRKVMWQTFLVILEYLHSLEKVTINFQDKLEYKKEEKEEIKTIINSPCYIG